MTREETKVIVRYIVSNFPNIYKGMPQAEKSALVDTWAVSLKDEDFGTVQIATIKYLENNSYPSLKAFRDYLRMLKFEDRSYEEFWMCILKAIRKGTYHSVEAFEELPEPCKKFIGHSSQLKEMASMDPSEISRVIKSQFMKRIPDIEKEVEVKKAREILLTAENVELLE